MHFQRLLNRGRFTRVCFLIHPVQEDLFMPNPLSADIRSRFERLFAEGLSGREIGLRLMISAASASRLSQKLRRA